MHTPTGILKPMKIHVYNISSVWVSTRTILGLPVQSSHLNFARAIQRIVPIWTLCITSYIAHNPLENFHEPTQDHLYTLAPDTIKLNHPPQYMYIKLLLGRRHLQRHSILYNTLKTHTHYTTRWKEHPLHQCIRSDTAERTIHPDHVHHAIKLMTAMDRWKYYATQI